MTVFILVALVLPIAYFIITKKPGNSIGDPDDNPFWRASSPRD